MSFRQSIPKIALFGQYLAASIHAANNGCVGEVITYTPALQEPVTLASHA
jgi:hypothetical protein